MDEPKVRPHTVDVIPAPRWGFYVCGGRYWSPTRKMAIAKAKSILQALLLQEQREQERFTIYEADLD